MEAYDRRMAALRAGDFVPPPDDSYDPAADMRAHASRHKKQAVEHDSYLSKEQLQELRMVQLERNAVSCHRIYIFFPLNMLLGGKNEDFENGCQAKHGRAHGRYRVRRLIRAFLALHDRFTTVVIYKCKLSFQ
jgi:hypothetical protein